MISMIPADSNNHNRNPPVARGPDGGEFLTPILCAWRKLAWLSMLLTPQHINKGCRKTVLISTVSRAVLATELTIKTKTVRCYSN